MCSTKEVEAIADRLKNLKARAPNCKASCLLDELFQISDDLAAAGRTADQELQRSVAELSAVVSG